MRKKQSGHKSNAKGATHNIWDTIKEEIQKPQNVEEIALAIRKWKRMKLPAGYGGINGAIIKGLKEKYHQLSDDPDLHPSLSSEDLYRYLDQKFSWTEEEEKKETARRHRHTDLMTFFEVRMILGTLVQGMPPAGYMDRLRKLGLYRAYKEELLQFGWSEDRINAFLNELGNYH